MKIYKRKPGRPRSSHSGLYPCRVSFYCTEAQKAACDHYSAAWLRTLVDEALNPAIVRVKVDQDTAAWIRYVGPEFDHILSGYVQRWLETAPDDQSRLLDPEPPLEAGDGAAGNYTRVSGQNPDAEVAR